MWENEQKAYSQPGSSHVIDKIKIDIETDLGMPWETKIAVTEPD